MKLRNILNEIINEAKQVGIVYHFTTLNNSIPIIKTNHLKAYHATKNVEGRTVSTTRDKYFSKRRGDQLSISGADIIFVLDGNKLSNVYQVRPYDDTYDAADREYDEDDRLDFGDEQEEIWYGKNIQRDLGFRNLDRFVLKLIFTKRLVDKIFSNPKKLFITGEDQVSPIFGDVNSFELNPKEKIEEIKKWFEGKGYTVEIEK